MKVRWKSIRDRYMKECRKLKTTSGQAAGKNCPWELMPLLQFLAPSVEPRKYAFSLLVIWLFIRHYYTKQHAKQSNWFYKGEV